MSHIDGQDENGLLVRCDGRLAAVLVKLGDMHGPEEGYWHLEVGFGACVGRPSTFAHLSGALRWVGECCSIANGELGAEIVTLVQDR